MRARCPLVPQASPSPRGPRSRCHPNLARAGFPFPLRLGTQSRYIHLRFKSKTRRPIPNSLAPFSEEFRAELESGFSVIYLLKRTTAYVLDTLFNTGLCAGTFGFALWKQGISPETLIGPGMIFLFVLFLLTFNWAIMTAQEMAFGTTLGKRIFGLALEGSASAIFLRAFFFLPSAGFCGVGLLWAFFDRRKRCWHDLVVNLQPIEIARL